MVMYGPWIIYFIGLVIKVARYAPFQRFNYDCIYGVTPGSFFFASFSLIFVFAYKNGAFTGRVTLDSGSVPITGWWSVPHCGAFTDHKKIDVFSNRFQVHPNWTEVVPAVEEPVCWFLYQNIKIAGVTQAPTWGLAVLIARNPT